MSSIKVTFREILFAYNGTHQAICYNGMNNQIEMFIRLWAQESFPIYTESNCRGITILAQKEIRTKSTPYRGRGCDDLFSKPTQNPDSMVLSRITTTCETKQFSWV